MNRRGFLSLLGAATVALLVPVPDLVLPTRTIFLPPRGGWVPNLIRGGNQLFTVQTIQEEMLRAFSVNLEFAAALNREYDQAFRRGDQWPLEFMGDRHDIRVGDRITIEGVRAK